MKVAESGRVGRRGTWVIPATLRRRFGLDEGALLVAEETPEGILVRPAAAVAVEVYPLERRAAFLLENATDPADYARAVDAVRAMGLDPTAIRHQPPPRARARARGRGKRTARTR